MSGRRIDNDALMRTVLVVEDDADVAALLITVLEEEAHCQALHAHNGYQAFAIAKHLQPDLLLLDYQLPDINGLELYDRLNLIEGFQGIPMLLVSVNPPIPELQRRGLPYLKKPFELDELLAKVDALIYQRIDVITYQYIQTAPHG